MFSGTFVADVGSIPIIDRLGVIKIFLTYNCCLKRVESLSLNTGVRCNSLVVFAYGVMGQSLMEDPFSYFLFQSVVHNWCNKGCGMYYPVWDDAYKRVAHVVTAVGLLSCYMIGPLPYAPHHITINKMFLVI